MTTNKYKRNVYIKKIKTLVTIIITQLIQPHYIDGH